MSSSLFASLGARLSLSVHPNLPSFSPHPKRSALLVVYRLIALSPHRPNNNEGLGVGLHPKSANGALPLHLTLYTLRLPITHRQKSTLPFREGLGVGRHPQKCANRAMPVWYCISLRWSFPSVHVYYPIPTMST